MEFVYLLDDGAVSGLYCRGPLTKETKTVTEGYENMMFQSLDDIGLQPMYGFLYSIRYWTDYAMCWVDYVHRQPTQRSLLVEPQPYAYYV